MESLENIEMKVNNLSAQVSLFADLCDIIKFADHYAKDEEKYHRKISSALIFITQEVQRISEICGDIQIDMR